MNIININNNFIEGALKAIELFKVVFDVNKNIIITSKNKIHINNTELLLQERNFNNKEFNFGFNFVLQNIDIFREKLCINPIFYLILLEQVFLLYRKEDKKELQKLLNNLEILKKFLIDYRNNSKLKDAKPNLEELFFIEKDFLKDDFLYDVSKQSYSLKFVEIKEEKFNIIEENNYYNLRCKKYGNGNIFKNKEVIIWFSKIKKDELNNFIDYILLNKKEVIIFYNQAEKDVQLKIEELSNYSNSFVFFHYPGLKFYDIMKDINILSGKTNNDIFYDSSFSNFYDYIPGKLKEVKFENGIAKIKSYKKYEDYEKYISYLKNYNHLERLLMMKGNGIIIKCKEDILEECRNIVSLSRSIYNNGVFYSEIYTLQLFLYYLKNNFTNNEKNVIIYLLLESLKNILNFYNTKAFNMLKNKIDSNDLSLFFNPISNNFQIEKIFTAYEIYEISFDLLISNLKVLLSFK